MTARPRRHAPSLDYAPEPPETAATEAGLIAKAQRGHNMPPEPATAGLSMTAEQWEEWLDHVFETARADKAKLMPMFARFVKGYPLKAGAPGQPPVGIERWNANIVGRAGDMRAEFRALIQLAERLHAGEKAPILRAGKAVDGFKNVFVADLEEKDSRGKLIPGPGPKAVMNVIGYRCTLFATWQEQVLRNEAQAAAKLLADQAAQAAAEAAQTMDANALQAAADTSAQAEQAAQVATAPSQDLTRTHGPMGSTTSLRSTWHLDASGSDVMELARAVVAGLAPVAYLALNDSRIGIAIRSEGLRECPGLAIQEVKSFR
jgi:hypothetical protein